MALVSLDQSSELASRSLSSRSVKSLSEEVLGQLAKINEKLDEVLSAVSSLDAELLKSETETYSEEEMD